MKHEDLLRRVLEAEAAKVDVGAEALPEIRRRIAERRPWWRSGRLAIFGGTFAAVTVAAVAIGVVSCEPNRSTAPPPQPGSSQTTPGPAPTSPAPVGSQPAGQAGPTGGSPAGGSTALLGVYYVGGDQPRLYREFHRLAVGDGSPAATTRAALAEMLTQGTAQDPDYTTAWPASARVGTVRVDGDVVTVDLTGAGEPTRMAVQQLVWTATAASGRSNVRLLLDGLPFTMQRRGQTADTLALVWLINPQHGDTVKRTFDVHVYGSAFEATVNLRVRQGGRVVTETFVTLSAGAPAFGEARKQLTLAPGRYTVEAYQVSAQDGSEQHLDDHAVTVS